MPDSSHAVVIAATDGNGVLLDTNAEVTSLRLGEAGSAILNITGGLLLCRSNSVVHTNGLISLSGELRPDSASPITFTIDGTVNWTAGSLNALGAATIKVGPAGILNITDTGLKTLNGNMVNQGIVACFATNLNATMFPRFINDNLFILHSNLSLTKSGPAAGFRNNGTIQTLAGSGVRTFDIGWGFTNLGTIKAESNSVLEVRPANLNDHVYFTDGTVFDGPGVVRFTDAYFHHWDGVMTLNTTLEYLGKSGGRVFWTGPGVFRWMGGESWMNDFTFGSGFQVEMAGSGAKLFGGDCTNLGTIRWIGNAQFRNVGASALFNNRGQFILETNCSFGGDLSGTFLNRAYILTPADAGTSSLTINLKFLNDGTIRAGTNSVLELGSLSPGEVHFFHNTVFDGEGIIRLLNSSLLTSSGSNRVHAILECFSDVVSSSRSTWTGTGVFRWLGEESLLADFTFAPGFNVEIAGAGFKRFAGVCTNLGNIRWLSDAQLRAGGVITPRFINNGQFILETNCVLTALGTSASFLNLGTILKPADNGTSSLAIDLNFTNHGTIRAETDSVLELMGSPSGEVRFAEGTEFDGAGIIRFLNSANEFHSDGTNTVNAILECFNSLSQSTWTGTGVFRWMGEAWLRDCTFGPDFQVEILGGEPKGFLGSCTNHGDIRWLGNARLFNGTDASFANIGQIILESNCLLTGVGATPDTHFLNTGTILKPADNGTSSLVIDLNFTNRGSIRAETNSVLELVSIFSGEIHLLNGTSFGGGGIIRLLNYVHADGTNVLDTVLECYSQIASGSHTFWRGNGVFRWLGEAWLSDFTFGPGFEVEIADAGNKRFGGACTNLGTIRWLANASIGNAENSVFNNSGQFIVETNCLFQVLATPPADFVNAGTIDLRNGTLTIEHNFIPTASSNVRISLGGLSPGSQFGRMVIAGNAPLNGNLSASLKDGFLPASGDSFAVVGYDSHTGQFLTTQLPALPGALTWQVDYNSTDITLNVVPSLSITDVLRLGDGNVRFDITGPAATAAIVQATTNLNPPAPWIDLATNAPFTGTHQFTDTQATNVLLRFYRAAIEP